MVSILTVDVVSDEVRAFQFPSEVLTCCFALFARRLNTVEKECDKNQPVLSGEVEGEGQ